MTLCPATGSAKRCSAAWHLQFGLSVTETLSPAVATEILVVMGVRRRRLWPWGGLLLLVAVTAVVVTYIVYAHDPESASTLVRALVGLATTACTAVG